MAWKLTSDRPIYLQLMECIELGIVSGRYAPGDRLPSVRELAAEAEVNPNTMQKALLELERTGLVYTQRTSGRYITQDRELIQRCKEEIANHHIVDFIEKMKGMGYTVQEIIDFMEAIKRRY